MSAAPPTPPASTANSAVPDDELEITTRAPALVASRAIVVAAACRRTHLELAPLDLGSDDPEGERFDLAAWVVEEGLDPVLTPAEQRLFKTRVGRLPRAEVLAASWQAEGLAALAWAIGILDDPPPLDAPADPAGVLTLLPSPWASTRALRTTATLRPEADLARERERAELWHWRAEIAQAAAPTSPKDERDRRSLVREVAEEAHAAGFIASPAGHDFPVAGRPYRDLSPDALDTLTIIAAERLRALNWLCGFGPDWDNVPLDV